MDLQPPGRNNASGLSHPQFVEAQVSPRKSLGGAPHVHLHDRVTFPLG